MKIVVLVKHVPDAASDRSFAADLTVDRAAVDGRLSRFCGREVTHKDAHHEVRSCITEPRAASVDRRVEAVGTGLSDRAGAASTCGLGDIVVPGDDDGVGDRLRQARGGQRPFEQFQGDPLPEGTGRTDA